MLAEQKAGLLGANNFARDPNQDEARENSVGQADRLGRCDRKDVRAIPALERIFGRGIGVRKGCLHDTTANVTESAGILGFLALQSEILSSNLADLGGLSSLLIAFDRGWVNGDRGGAIY